ncbi:MAG: isopenicillin N synthase family dioxygenase [Betaproteobacteria bacterium]
MSIAASRRADFSEIPIIDVGDIYAAVGEIREACEDVGFFYAKNHGVPLAQQDGMFEQCRRFFALPQEERDALLLTKSPHYRGYLPIGARGSDQKRQRDLLESFNIGSERGPDDPFVRAGKPLHGPNQWPGNLPGFREAILAYYTAMEGLMRRLLQGISLAMGCERHALDGMFRNPVSQLRLLHYPAQQQGEIVDMIGARAHRDFGVLTILLQDDVGGLEVQNDAGEWVVAPPIRDTFVVNFGLMMLHLSNERYLAAQHRVINRYGRERFSIPFFVNPDYDATLETLPQFLARGEEPRYPPAHAGEKLRAFYHNLWPSAGKGSLQ